MRPPRRREQATETNKPRGPVVAALLVSLKHPAHDVAQVTQT